jgi:hypothetical protein
MLLHVKTPPVIGFKWEIPSTSRYTPTLSQTPITKYIPKPPRISQTSPIDMSPPLSKAPHVPCTTHLFSSSRHLTCIPVTPIQIRAHLTPQHRSSHYTAKGPLLERGRKITYQIALLIQEYLTRIHHADLGTVPTDVGTSLLEKVNNLGSVSFLIFNFFER